MLVHEISTQSALLTSFAPRQQEDDAVESSDLIDVGADDVNFTLNRLHLEAQN
jgi:hypothetical protein